VNNLDGGEVFGIFIIAVVYKKLFGSQPEDGLMKKSRNML